jgi:hypothetical protein
LHNAKLHQLSSHPMYRENGLLSFALDRDETCLWLLSSGAVRGTVNSGHSFLKPPVVVC